MCPKGAGRSFNVEKCVQKVEAEVLMLRNVSKKVQAEVQWREMCPKGADRSFNVEKYVQKVQAEVKCVQKEQAEVLM